MFHILPKRTKLSLWTSTALLLVFVIYLIGFFFRDHLSLALYYIALVPIIIYTDYVASVSKYLIKINDTANIIAWEHRKLLWFTLLTASFVLGIFLYQLEHYYAFGQVIHAFVAIILALINIYEIIKFFNAQHRYS
ncbi:hypothetical protein ETI06_00565 [Macrococcoides goetzii]|nr:hypothetical protein [Macrococcus goetzii]TDM50501.1 hypothetical protein ETI06_00565 [Macrococcus goetzii]